MRIFVLTANKELRVSRKIYLRDHPREYAERIKVSMENVKLRGKYLSIFSLVRTLVLWTYITPYCIRATQTA
jgi:hypothetical protein